jgi:uncharacterized protein
MFPSTSSRKSKTEKSWTELLDHVRRRATMMDSPLHGDKHWRGVAFAGMRICDLFPACDRDVVLAFAMLHDFQRLNDDFDPEHGLRASVELRKSTQLRKLLGELQIEKLAYACEYHDKGTTSGDATIGACWDADRSNLWRVGVTPHIGFFSVLKDEKPFDHVAGHMMEYWVKPPEWKDMIMSVAESSTA